MPGKLPLSVSIITNNEEKIIERTLTAIADIAGEIIVVDSGSTDRTIEIAENLGAKVYPEEWKGYSAQKNSALEKCTMDWILSLDADEIVTPDLKHSIRNAIAENNHDGYFINRKTVYLGKLLKYSWQPDGKLRLVRKSAGPEWTGDIVHEELKVTGRTGMLDGYLEHYSYRNVIHHYQKTIEYARASAEKYHDNGRKFKMINLLVNPWIAFWRMYLLRGAFRDGVRGLMASVSSLVYTYLKYVFIWEKQKTDKTGRGRS